MLGGSTGRSISGETDERFLLHPLISSNELGEINEDWVVNTRQYSPGTLPDPKSAVLDDLGNWVSSHSIGLPVLHLPGKHPLFDVNDLTRIVSSSVSVGIGSEDNSYALVISDEALQNAFDPLLSLVELREKLEPGGHLLLVTSMHGPVTKETFFRFTLSGAATLLAQAGFKVLERGGLTSPQLARDSYVEQPVATGKPPLILSEGYARDMDPRGVPVDFWFLARRAEEPKRKSGVGGRLAGAQTRSVQHVRLSPPQLSELWSAHAQQAPAYFAKHSFPLQAERNRGANLLNLLNAKRDYPRVPITLDFAEWVVKHRAESPRRFLSTDPSDVELHSLRTAAGGTTHVCAHVHRQVGKKEFGDLHLLDQTVHLRGQPFDLAVVSQTLEHLYDPLLSLVNLRHKLALGGLLFTSTPTVNRPHMTPFHFRHYSPMGLAAVLTQAGFEILEMGQWGNARYINTLFAMDGSREWPSYVNGHVTAEGVNVSDPSAAEVENDPLRPVQVWALARRPVNDTDPVPSADEREPRYKNAVESPCYYHLPPTRRNRKPAAGLSPLALAALQATQEAAQQDAKKKKEEKKRHRENGAGP